MPLETDYEFGKSAVSAGLLKQEELEECVEILIALERVGSKQRLWDVVQRKGYMTDAGIAQIRPKVEGAPAKAAPGASRRAAEAKDDDVAEETAADLNLPRQHARGFALAHVHKGGQTKVYPLPPRAVTVGKGASCDISLSDAGVLETHAMLNFRADTYAIEAAGPGANILVNDRRVRARELEPYDLIELGSAMLLFLPDFGDQPADEPVDVAAAGHSPSGRIQITEGARKGARFFLGSSPLVIGRHTLANVRLKESAVGEFQAQIARTPEGIRLVDLLSVAGTKVNGVHAVRKMLQDGDNITIGPVSMTFHPLVPAAAGKSERDTGPAVDKKAKSDLDWDLGAEVEPVTDPMLRRGTKVPREDAVARAKPRPFKPGELRLMCIEGPLEGKKFVVAKNRMLIGREAGLDLTIPDNSVSRHHAEIVLSPTKAEVKDLGSRNGIFVNGARVTVAALRPGDTIRIHKTLFIVEEIPPRPQSRKP